MDLDTVLEIASNLADRPEIEPDTTSDESE
jgi:hypothetical protein